MTPRMGTAHMLVCIDEGMHTQAGMQNNSKQDGSIFLTMYFPHFIQVH